MERLVGTLALCLGLVVKPPRDAHLLMQVMNLSSQKVGLLGSSFYF